ncbi:thioredoxin family protein [Candidatus Saccharibacteria bacterium]|nr:thioredoxin family protein [Candidatus Saccharibacteria bacterium]
MKIEVIGTGCPTCKKLHELTLRAAEDIGKESQVEYIADEAGLKRLMELGLMRSPALAVDGKVVLIGYEPSVDKIKSLIVNKGE